MSAPVPSGPTRYQCALHAITETERTIEAVQVLKESNFVKFGKLMNESHASLKYVFFILTRNLQSVIEMSTVLAVRNWIHWCP